MEKIKSNLISTVHYLSKDIGQRSYLDIASLHKTATYIETLFSSFGYEPIRQPYAYRGNTYQNIAVEAKGFDSSRNDLLVIGAHYDTVIGTSGADDNASGIAGLLELARLVRGNPISRTRTENGIESFCGLNSNRASQETSCRRLQFLFHEGFSHKYSYPCFL